MIRLLLSILVAPLAEAYAVARVERRTGRCVSCGALLCLRCLACECLAAAGCGECEDTEEAQWHRGASNAAAEVAA